MDEIEKVLSDDKLKTLRGRYDRDAMTNLLSSGIPRLDRHTIKYIHSIRKAFYDSSRLKPVDRERCLIGILASRDSGLNLALHIYIGLMEDLSPDDVADVIFLGGIYTGVDRISDGLDTLVRTLTVLAQIATSPEDCTVLQVATALRAAFKPPPPAPR
jgi:alkylhydroperoxidase/carboxymuconolactone decarboxylase family protein YurZ